jgi:hypothetical protein
MKKTLLEIYGLAVCLLAVICITLALGATAWNVLVMVYPEMSLDSYTWGQHQSDEKYREFLVTTHPNLPEESPYVPPEGAMLTQQRQDSLSIALRGVTRDALQAFVKAIISLVLNALLFLIHWKIAAKARRNDRLGR